MLYSHVGLDISQNVFLRGIPPPLLAPSANARPSASLCFLAPGKLSPSASVCLSSFSLVRRLRGSCLLHLSLCVRLRFVVLSCAQAACFVYPSIATLRPFACCKTTKAKALQTSFELGWQRAPPHMKLSEIAAVSTGNALFTCGT